MVWRIQFHSLEGILNSGKIFPLFIVGSAKGGKEAKKNPGHFCVTFSPYLTRILPFLPTHKKVFLDAISVLGSFSLLLPPEQILN